MSSLLLLDLVEVSWTDVGNFSDLKGLGNVSKDIHSFSLLCWSRSFDYLLFNSKDLNRLTKYPFCIWFFGFYFSCDVISPNSLVLHGVQQKQEIYLPGGYVKKMSRGEKVQTYKLFKRKISGYLFNRLLVPF